MPRTAGNAFLPRRRRAGWTLSTGAWFPDAAPDGVLLLASVAGRGRRSCTTSLDRPGAAGSVPPGPGPGRTRVARPGESGVRLGRGDSLCRRRSVGHLAPPDRLRTGDAPASGSATSGPLLLAAGRAPFPDPARSTARREGRACSARGFQRGPPRKSESISLFRRVHAPTDRFFYGRKTAEGTGCNED